MAPGTPRRDTGAMVQEMSDAVDRTVARLTDDGTELVAMSFGSVGRSGGRQFSRITGDQYGGLTVELIPSDQRDVRTGEFVEAWRKEIRQLPNVEQINLNARAGGPPGREVDIRLRGGTADDLKAAATEVKSLLGRFPGIGSIDDDLPFGKQELILEVTPRGKALGFTTQSAGLQVRNAFQGTIAQRYGLGYRFKGKAEEQAESAADMGAGAITGLVAIYIVLAWVFANFSRPFVVMAIIPFGFVGTVLGHLLLGFDITILSMIGLLGLSGILVNNSIILVRTVDQHIDDHTPLREAIVAGCRDRLRPVLLTSLTTIGGLAPLLFETSLQAQFLIPMANTIVFGLAVATLIVLVLIPALLVIDEDIRAIFRRLRRGRNPAPATG